MATRRRHNECADALLDDQGMGIMTIWNIWSHFLADAQVAITLGFCLHIVIPGKGRPA